MREKTEAIILKATPYGENKLLLVVFSKDFGKFAGMVRVGRKYTAKKSVAVFQQGNIVEVERFRRLETQLGSLNVELLASPSASCWGDFKKLQIFHYISEVLGAGLHDDEPHQSLYRATKEILQTIHQEGLWQRLGFYELKLLSELGYGLSLDREHAVTELENALAKADGGEVQTTPSSVYTPKDSVSAALPEARRIQHPTLAKKTQKTGCSPLMYVSPKTGRAVSEVMGEPYKEKLLPLPQLFGGKSEDFQDVFRLTGHFLTQALHGKKLDARAQLLAELEFSAV